MSFLDEASDFEQRTVNEGYIEGYRHGLKEGSEDGILQGFENGFTFGRLFGEIFGFVLYIVSMESKPWMMDRIPKRAFSTAKLILRICQETFVLENSESSNSLFENMILPKYKLLQKQLYSFHLAHPTEQTTQTSSQLQKIPSATSSSKDHINELSF